MKVKYFVYTLLLTFLVYTLTIFVWLSQYHGIEVEGSTAIDTFISVENILYTDYSLTNFDIDIENVVMYRTHFEYVLYVPTWYGVQFIVEINKDFSVYHIQRCNTLEVVP